MTSMAQQHSPLQGLNLRRGARGGAVRERGLGVLRQMRNAWIFVAIVVAVFIIYEETSASNEVSPKIIHDEDSDTVNKSLRFHLTGAGEPYDMHTQIRKKQHDLETSESFVFSSGVREYDDAYLLALSEMKQNIENGAFIAGAGWTQLWTRDTSYAIELAGGLVQPRASRKSLELCTEKVPGIGNVWLQDVCGHFKGWPNLSDAIVGAKGAWSLYLITGNRQFLSWAYDITKNSLKRAERDVYDDNSGLFLGCSSFMESNSGYPKKYKKKGALVAKTKALSTNMLYYIGYKVGAMMGSELDAPELEIRQLDKKARKLRSAIRNALWLPKHGYYAYFEDENSKVVPHMEGLGESLALLAPDFEIDTKRINSIFQNTYTSQYGIPCLWPRFNISEVAKNSASFYHNGRLWPFVQGYWAIAAARHDKVDTFAKEFEGLVALSQINNTFAEFYELDGQSMKERRRQLWSDTGFLAMVYQGLFGMTFETRGVRFRPVKPAAHFADTISLRNVHYRGINFHVYVTGKGYRIRTFKVNGEAQDDPFLPNRRKGEYKIEILLS